MHASLAQCRYLLSLAEPILNGLDDSHRALEPQLGAKTAGWLIGHRAGIPLLLIQPTRASFFDRFPVSRDHRFRVRARSECTEVMGSF